MRLLTAVVAGKLDVKILIVLRLDDSIAPIPILWSPVHAKLRPTKHAVQHDLCRLLFPQILTLLGVRVGLDFGFAAF